jgi:hypothetical protein
MQVNAQLIPEDNFVQHLNTLLELCAKHNIPATEFEMTFLLASLHFKHSNCEAVVLEVIKILYLARCSCSLRGSGGLRGPVRRHQCRVHSCQCDMLSL